MTQTRPRRRPLTYQEKLALQERKQRRREKMEESRPYRPDLLLAGDAVDGHRSGDPPVRQLSLRLL